MTVGWNIVEGVVAVTAAWIAGSVALLAFGLDSFVECASGLVMIWRLRAESDHRANVEAIERRAQRLVAASLFLLAAWVCIDASHALWSYARPEFSGVGVGLVTLSIAVMLWLARAKRRVAKAIESRAMLADAFQTTACFWLSVATLLGIACNGLFGWWWADPVAALVIAGLVIREGVEAWKGRGCC